MPLIMRFAYCKSDWHHVPRFLVGHEEQRGQMYCHSEVSQHESCTLGYERRHREAGEMLQALYWIRKWKIHTLIDSTSILLCTDDAFSN